MSSRIMFHCETCWLKFREGDYHVEHHWTSLNAAMTHIEATRHEVELIEDIPEDDE